MWVEIRSDDSDKQNIYPQTNVLGRHVDHICSGEAENLSEIEFSITVSQNL